VELRPEHGESRNNLGVALRALGGLDEAIAEFRRAVALDPDAVVREVDETDGYQRWAPVAFRLAGTLDHGTDHRSQICTALTTLGVEPPKIDVMNFGLDTGGVTERWPDP
jgi:uncharacterized damage-inducible protein DinB